MCLFNAALNCAFWFWMFVRIRDKLLKIWMWSSFVLSRKYERLASDLGIWCLFLVLVLCSHTDESVRKGSWLFTVNFINEYALHMIFLNSLLHEILCFAATHNTNSFFCKIDKSTNLMLPEYGLLSCGPKIHSIRWILLLRYNLWLCYGTVIV
jgi:hypothetical protein